jgi:hypothetical protein
VDVAVVPPKGASKWLGFYVVGNAEHSRRQGRNTAFVPNPTTLYTPCAACLAESSSDYNYWLPLQVGATVFIGISFSGLVSFARSIFCATGSRNF